MSNKSLAYRLGLYISMSVFMVFVVFMFLIIRFHVASRKKSNENNAKIQSSEIYREFNDLVVKTRFVCSEISNQTEFYHNHGGIPILLTGILKEYDHIKSVELKINRNLPSAGDSFYIAVASGKEIRYHQSNKGAEEFFINEDTLLNYLPKLTEPGWSEPFLWKKMGMYICVYNYPFKKTDETGKILISGSVRCILALNDLNKMMDKTKILENGYAFLVSPKGLFMTYPLQQYIMKRNVYMAYYKENKKNQSELASFMKGESMPLVVYPPALSYKKARSFSARIEESNWILVFTVPYSELYQNIYTLMIQMSVVIVVLVIAIFFLVFSVAKRVMMPLTKISNELHKFSIELLGQNPETNNETAALRKSLERLQERYEKNKKYEAEAAQRGSKFLSDLALASEIQQSIIPHSGNYSFQNSGISIHSIFRPAQYVSGDLYDFFMIDNNRLLITMGDVSGGGIPAALFMGVAHTYIRSNASYKKSKDIVNQVNKQLCKNNTNQFFLTLFLGILDITNGKLNYCSAGHTPAIVHTGTANLQELNKQHGVPLGLYPDREYSDSTITIHRGDSLILYTDGVTEHQNEAGEFYGVSTLYSLINQLKHNNPEETATMIIQSVDQFGSGVTQHNDLSLMVVNYN